MIFKSDEPSQANGQVELSKSIGIDQLEASGFAGRQKTAVPAFATIRKGKNDSSKCGLLSLATLQTSLVTTASIHSGQAKVLDTNTSHDAEITTDSNILHKKILL